FLMEVDMEGAIRRMEERYVADLRSTLRTANVRHRGVRRKSEGGIDITLRTVSDQDKARETILRELPDLELTAVEKGAPDRVRARLSQRAKDELSEFALEQNITALRNRIDELGVAEPVVQRQGDRRIVVQLPGVQDTARAKRILGRTATLEMMLVDEEHNVDSA
ncbi:MAG TPA: protein translocase subunit SecD, partial [Gammaproteobacteria bacterium]|nr:protein translocase subunit SecD [Gammaproteobacteria bacterium]